ncbi:MAG: methylated-DNA--[protein]-cysteine S-methyltransferase [Deltaproteobacteria bacterium]|jgi:methylated-DNA-[protein]-cysteine S-methyltransferase|nr:methylated-DNA--[protein]-cysteine S-methyltransferase [Deltaproteobacteria bacterium]
MFYSTWHESPFGRRRLLSDGENLVGLGGEKTKYFPPTMPGGVQEEPDLPVFGATKSWLDSYFAGRQPAISDLPLAPAGSDFRKAVWDVLCGIPYGQWTTYGQVAKLVARRLGRKSMSGQAVGGAVGHNPIGIIIPCHRVVGANGSLTGYGSGLDLKARLLAHEGVDLSGFFIPRRGTAL